MFDHLNRQRKQKNWKILNLNFNETQQQPQYNRSSIIQPTKKYCPKKDTSKQRIFSKSKQRLIKSGSQTSSSTSFYLKGLNNNTSLKQNGVKNTQTSIQPTLRNMQGQQNSKINKLNNNQLTSMNTSQMQVNQEYQTGPRINVRKSTINQLNNSGFEQIMNVNKTQQKINQSLIIDKQQKQKLKRQINDNNQAILHIKQQFEEFKSLIITELNEQKQFLRQTLNRVLGQFEYIKQKIREQIYSQIEMKRKSRNASQRDSRKNSTEIRLQDVLKLKEFQFDQQKLNKLDSQLCINIDTFGVIQQQSSVPQFRYYDENIPQLNELKDHINQLNQSNDNNINQLTQSKHSYKNQNELKSNNNSQDPIVSNQSQVKQILEFNQSSQNFNNNQPLWEQFTENHQHDQNVYTQKQINPTKQNKNIALTQQLRTYKSSDNFKGISSNQINIKNHQYLSKQDMNSIILIQSPSKQYISTKQRIEQKQQKKRYSQILKKQYQDKGKISSQVNKLDKQKINERISHLSKFQGAMQKLKTQIMQIKTISDTKDLKKIKFSQQKPIQNYLKQIKLNQIYPNQHKSSCDDINKAG